MQTSYSTDLNPAVGHSPAAGPSASARSPEDPDIAPGGDYGPGEYVGLWSGGRMTVVVASSRKDAAVAMERADGCPPDSVLLLEAFFEE
jgi:hypothetical protein